MACLGWYRLVEAVFFLADTGAACPQCPGHRPFSPFLSFHHILCFHGCFAIAGMAHLCLSLSGADSFENAVVKIVHQADVRVCGPRVELVSCLLFCFALSALRSLSTRLLRCV